MPECQSERKRRKRLPPCDWHHICKDSTLHFRSCLTATQAIKLFSHASHPIFSDPGFSFFSNFLNFWDFWKKEFGHLFEELVGKVQYYTSASLNRELWDQTHCHPVICFLEHQSLFWRGIWFGRHAGVIKTLLLFWPNHSPVFLYNTWPWVTHSYIKQTSIVSDTMSN